MSHKENENKVLSSTAERLGLGDEPTVYKKAEEFLRVLQTKASIKNVNDYARAVFCLDLASSVLGIGFDKETGIKLSGVKKSVYKNNLNILEKVLELDKPISVKEVCVQCSCTVATELAEKIYKAYKSQGIGDDFDHPQYVAISVYTACRLMNFKVPKPQFRALSRLKPSQWKELEVEFTKFTSKIGLGVDNKMSNKVTGRSELHTYLEECVNKEEKMIKSPTKNTQEEKQMEDYEVWKNRILTEAREQLKKMKTS